MLHIGNHISIASAQQGSNLNQDANADAFILAAGITDSVQKSAITTFVKDLKAINAVQSGFVDFATPANSILKVCYPLVGGNSTAHKYNLINPVNTDVAYRQVYGGTITHDEKGIRTAGVNTSYANTFFNPYTEFAGNPTSCGMDIFVNSSFTTNASRIEVGTKGAGWSFVGPNFGNGQSYWKGLAINHSLFKRVGLFQLNQTADSISGVKVLGNKEQVAINSVAVTGAHPNRNFYIGGNLGDTYYSDNIVSYLAFRIITISDSANILYQNAIIKLQKALNRFPQKSVYIEGHSMTVDNQRRLEMPIVNACNKSYNNRILNNWTYGSSGATISTITGRYTSLPKSYDDASTKIMVLFIGVNDLHNGITPTNAWNALKAYVQTAVSDGYKVVALTCLPSNYANEVDRNDYNSLMKSDMPIGGSYVDLDLITELADYTNTTYYQDGLHPKAAGYDLIGIATAAIIDTVI